MFVLVRKTIVVEGYGDKVVEQFNNRDLVRKQKGFVDVTVLRSKPRKGEEEIIVITRWESEQDWKNWEKSDVHIAAHRAKLGQPKPDYIIHSEGGRYTVALVKEAIQSEESFTFPLI